MTLVRVQTFWVNPETVIAVYATHHSYRGEPEYWKAHLVCEEKQCWSWRFDTEEAAHRYVEKIAEQVNAGPPTFADPADDPLVTSAFAQVKAAKQTLAIQVQCGSDSVKAAAARTLAAMSEAGDLR